jgi:hypothetical protein
VADPSFERDLRVILEKELASGQATIAPVPQWARDCAHLDVFNANTLPDSWKTGKAMLRQQCPDFHEHKDWKHYAARWAGLQKGVIQNRILDLIKSALENLANASANPATEI